MEGKVLKEVTLGKAIAAESEVVLEARDLHVWYGANEALKGINISFYRNRVHAIIGPSGCGKSTLLRCFNRLHELGKNVRVQGEILNHGENLLAMDTSLVRKRMGMVFQKPNPFPYLSIYENVLVGYRLNNIRLSRQEADEIVEYTLKKPVLWNEVKDKLDKSGIFLSGGQQQRLCIARALAMGPDFLLLDEPTSALDPMATASIESLMQELQERITIIIVTHNLQQAARVSDYVAFMLLGELIEYGRTQEIYFNPQHEKTEMYIEGSFG
jgi:phosphate transport system ATP-binding protein